MIITNSINILYNIIIYCAKAGTVYLKTKRSPEAVETE